MTAERWLTPVDVRLLAELAREPNLVHAARTLGIGRDRAVYRLSRMARLYGGPVAKGAHGGKAAGTTRLTPLGRRLLAGSSAGRGTNRWSGEYRAGPPPHVALSGGAALEVSFPGRSGEPVVVEVDPAAIVVSLRPIDSSARNVLPVVVSTVRSRGKLQAELLGAWHGLTVHVVVTPKSVERLHLAPGRAAYLHVKAPAVRRVPA
jgi:molybdopterin-binding protein/molybdate transport repressor ModE-like protein